MQIVRKLNLVVFYKSKIILLKIAFKINFTKNLINLTQPITSLTALNLPSGVQFKFLIY
jgi:hypothetical protein